MLYKQLNILEKSVAKQAKMVYTEIAFIFEKDL